MRREGPGDWAIGQPADRWWSRRKVSGVLVCGKPVRAAGLLQRVRIGDIHHVSLLIEQGAMFDGRSRRAASETDLNAIVDGKGPQ